MVWFSHVWFGLVEFGLVDLVWFGHFSLDFQKQTQKKKKTDLNIELLRTD